MSIHYCLSCMQSLTQPGDCPLCGGPAVYTAPQHHLLPGSVLQNRYFIGKSLGEGGFGITYIGRDLTQDAVIAVKEYFPSGFSYRNNQTSNFVTMATDSHADAEKDMQRFMSEAKALARFQDEPGVVGIRDFFRENGTAYIVMEYLDGITLKKFLQENGKLPAAGFITMIDPVLLTLEKIHKQGLIHRDISPDNIMLLKNGSLKLLDFGAAREVGGEKSLSVMLKPGYAPEEQYRSRGSQGPWTDVYAMSATIYKCITGVTPDEAPQRVFRDELQPPSQLGAAISPGQESALMLGLAVHGAQRLQSISALRRALQAGGAQPYLPKSGVKTVPVHHQPSSGGSRSVSGGPRSVSGSSVGLKPRKEKSVKRTLTTVAIVAAVLVLSLVGLIAIGSGAQPEGSPSLAQKPQSSDSRDTIDRLDSSAAQPSAAQAPEGSWKDFVFTLEGVTYQLPAHLSEFQAAGWTLDEERSGIYAGDVMTGYAHQFVYLTQEPVGLIGAELINMSGNGRPVEDCDVGAIVVSAVGSQELALPKGLSCRSTADQIQAAYGEPSTIDRGSDGATLLYQASENAWVSFYLCDSGGANTVTVQNFAARDRDATTPSDQRPAYLDSYVPPQSLGSDVTATCFSLDGKLYQLPCPLEQFTQEGWTLSADGVSSLGFGREAYGVHMTKDGRQVELILHNFSQLEEYTRNCVVTGVTFYSFDFPQEDLAAVQLPGGMGLTSTLDDAGMVYSDFSYTNYGKSATFAHENDDGTALVQYDSYPNDGTVVLSLRNHTWWYG